MKYEFISEIMSDLKPRFNDCEFQIDTLCCGKTITAEAKNGMFYISAHPPIEGEKPVMIGAN